MAARKKQKPHNHGDHQLPMFTPSSEWRPTPLGELPSWEGAKRVAFDVETCDPQLKDLGCGARRPDTFICGYSFAIEDGPSHYVPVRHEGGDNVDEEMAFRYLRDQARSHRLEIVGAHLPYDLDHSAEYGVEWHPETRFRDIQVADPLINELHMSYSLAAISERRGLPPKDEALLQEAARHYNVDPKGGMWRLPARFVGAYGERDASLPLMILRRQERDIEEQKLWDIWNLESDVLPVLVKMRRRGIRIDQDRLAEVERWSLEQEAEALALVKHQTGHEIAVGDVWKADALAPALERKGIKVPTSLSRGKQRYNIDKFFLAKIDHPVADALAWARKTNKLRTTFAASVKRYMVNGRIHPTFLQLRKTKEEGNERGEEKGAAFGRLSCEDPNLQQQPSRDEFAPFWRSIYLPEEGSEFGACDFSQQEPRWTVHYAEKLKLERATEAAERYRQDPSTDNHQMMAELAGVARKPAKELFLGKCYGMGGAKLCRKLDLPTRWGANHGRMGRGHPLDWHTEYFPLNQHAKAVAYCKEHGIPWQGHMRINFAGLWEMAGEEGQAIITRFDEQLPFVKQLAKRCQETAKERGYIITAGGRRCRFPVDKHGNYDWTHKALNRLIQGSSADQTKRALVDGDRAGYFIQLQVHDEIDGSFTNRKEAEGLAEIMSNSMPSGVPFKVDVEMGTSWGDSMENGAA